MADFEVNFTLEPQQEITADLKLEVGGITEHDKLSNRDLPDQHPISAITGLQEALDTIPDDYVSDAELESALLEKQDVISDLAAIRRGATLGATAVQPSELNNYATQNWVENKGYLTEIPAEYVTDSELTAKGYQTAEDVETAITAKGYITMPAVEAKGYITNAALAGYATESYVTTKVGEETTARQNADNNLQSQIDAITASSDVTDIVGTYAELQVYDTSTLAPNSIIKVLQDENRNNETTYYRWVITGGVGAWSLIGEEGPYYTISAADAKFATQTALSTGLSGKQDTINDLAAIRSGASAGATAVQPSDLATVATSGDYDDLSNKPTIPSIAGLESISNKVTSISSASTNTEYPSAKCVYDIVGDIETLINAL